MAAVVTIASSRKNTLGAWKFGVADVTMDSSYPTGGESVLPADFGITTVYMVFIDNASGYVAEYDYTSKLLKVMVPVKVVHNGGGAGDAVGADNPPTQIQGNLTGTTTTDLVMQEVENATDLSSVKFRVTMIGE